MPEVLGLTGRSRGAAAIVRGVWGDEDQMGSAPSTRGTTNTGGGWRMSSGTPIPSRGSAIGGDWNLRIRSVVASL